MLGKVKTNYIFAISIVQNIQSHNFMDPSIAANKYMPTVI